LDYTLNVSPIGLSPIDQDTMLHYPAYDGSVIVPMIDSPGKYYVFTNEVILSIYNDPVWSFAVYNPCVLYYSVVDMSLNNGYGDIEPGRKGILLDSTLENMDGIEAIAGDNCNVWVLTHDLFNT